MLYHKILYKIFCKVISSVEVLSLTFVFCCQISPIDDHDDGDDVVVVVVLLTVFCSFLCALRCINCCSVIENCTPKYSCRYVGPRRRRLHLLVLVFFLLFLSEDDDDDDAREIVIVEKEIGLRLAS